MNVILIGYRGSGKTTVGKMLAGQLWKTFVDVDERVCQRFDGKTIREIWGELGEAAFRQMEAAVTAEILEMDNQVVALGGGTVMVPEGRRMIEEVTGAVRIYLKCAAEVLYERINADETRAATRPWPIGGGRGREMIEAHLAEREPVYEAVADQVFDVTHVGLAETVRYLIQRCL